MNPEFSQPAPKKSRMKLYILIGVVVVLVPVIAIFGIIAIVFGAVFYGTKSVDEYQCALKEVRTNEKAIELIGEPMEEGFFLFPNIEINGPRRDVNFSTSITGPKNSGTLYVFSERSNFRSNYKMVLDVDNEKTELYNGSYPCK